MPERKVQFINGEIYHIVMRAVDGTKLFRNEQDYLRMIHDLFEFNDSNPTLSTFRAKCHHSTKHNISLPDLVVLEEGLNEGNKRFKKIVI